jgi:hypothetical protein
MNTKAPRRGGDRITTALSDGEYTRAQLADQVGMPVGTLRRWVKDGVYTPDPAGRDQTVGTLTFHVFTETDLTNVRQLCRQRGVKVKRVRSRAS